MKIAGMVGLALLSLVTMVACAQPDHSALEEYEAAIQARAPHEVPRDGRTILLFIHSKCPACGRMVEALPSYAGEVDWYVVTRTLDKTILKQLYQHVPPERVIFDAEGEIGRVFSVERVPSTAFLEDGIRVLYEEWPLQRDLGELASLVSGFLQGRYVAPPQINIVPGQTLAGWTVADEEGRLVDLSQIQRPALLTFFSRNCPACRQQLPVVEEFSSEHGLPVFLIEPDDQEGPSPLAADSPVRILVDRGRQVTDGLGVSVTPVNLLIDESGVVVWVDIGFREDLEQVLLLLKRDYLDSP